MNRITRPDKLTESEAKVLNKIRQQIEEEFPQEPTYLWIPVHPDFLVNKPTSPGAVIWACILETTAQELLDGIKAGNPMRDDLPPNPTKVTLQFLREFSGEQGYDFIILLETRQRIPTIKGEA